MRKVEPSLMVKKDGMILENTSLKLYLTSKDISMRRYQSLCFKAKCSVLILIKSR